MSENNNEKILLPHHVQQELCTTRLPYRQGRKLTAVKVYTINTESNHLLIFGVPSLNLRRELKSHFIKFGKLTLFCVSKEHESEDFTETYHAVYDKIHSARIAKRMMDTKNFYGGSLHVCYAPELETLDETRQKILIRKTDVINRLNNLRKEAMNNISKVALDDNIVVNEGNASVRCNTEIVNEIRDTNVQKLNMGEVNTINIGGTKVNEKKRKFKDKNIHKKIKHSKTDVANRKNQVNETDSKMSTIETIDCTSVETEVVTNVNEHLNYNKFGEEKVVEIPYKPLNKIKFNFVNKKL